MYKYFPLFRKPFYVKFCVLFVGKENFSLLDIGYSMKVDSNENEKKNKKYKWRGANRSFTYAPSEKALSGFLVLSGSLFVVYGFECLFASCLTL
jgi:hypothetical protein